MSPAERIIGGHRLDHWAEILTVEGQSLRLQETNELATPRAQAKPAKGAKQRLPLALP